MSYESLGVPAPPFPPQQCPRMSRGGCSQGDRILGRQEHPQGFTDFTLTLALALSLEISTGIRSDAEIEIGFYFQ